MSTDTMLIERSPHKEPAMIRKFMFDRSFNDETAVNRPPERKPVLMKPEQIDALKKEAFDEGVLIGRKEGMDQQSARISAILTKVEQNVSALIQSISDIAKEQEDHVKTLSLAIAKKIVPSFVERNGTVEIESLIENTIREMAREPRLVVRVNESEYEALDSRIQEIATRRAYAGKVIVIAEEAIASGDCRIEWVDGGASRDTAKTWNAIEQTIISSSQ